MQNPLVTLTFPLVRYIGGLVEKEQRRTGLLPLGYFYLLSRLVPMPAVELVVYRMQEGEPEVLLTKRSADDPHWPNLWHLPGTILRNGDSMEKVWKRLSGEVSVSALPGTPEPKTFELSNNERGWGSHTYHILRVDASWVLGEGRFFPLEHLPEETVLHHKEHLAHLALQLT